jgi:hypothetical protein
MVVHVCFGKVIIYLVIDEIMQVIFMDISLILIDSRMARGSRGRQWARKWRAARTWAVSMRERASCGAPTSSSGVRQSRRRWVEREPWRGSDNMYIC